MSWWHSQRVFDPREFDYPGTAYFIQARRVLTPRAPRIIRGVVIHITGGPATHESGAINEFLARHVRTNPAGRVVPAGASAHYIVNREGIVIQTVHEADIANHVYRMDSPFNADSIGIEHVNPYNAQTQMAARILFPVTELRHLDARPSLRGRPVEWLKAPSEDKTVVVEIVLAFGSQLILTDDQRRISGGWALPNGESAWIVHRVDATLLDQRGHCRIPLERS